MPTIPSKENVHVAANGIISSFLWLSKWLLCPWNSLGRNTRMGRYSLPQGIFPTQGSNQGLLHCRQILYWLSYKGSPPYCWKGLKPRPLIGSRTSIFLRGRIEDYSLGETVIFTSKPSNGPWGGQFAIIPEYTKTPRYWLLTLKVRGPVFPQNPYSYVR